jgi:hypothetical protein
MTHRGDRQVETRIAPPGELRWCSEWERLQPLFVDWVYFKFFSAKVQGIIVYGCACGLPGVILAQVFRRGAGGEVLLPATDILRQDYSRAQSWRARGSFDCRIAESTLATTAAGYEIHGAVADAAHRVEWDLAYDRLSPPIAAFAYRGFGWLRAGRVGWKVLAPLAAVRGSVVLDGEHLEVEGKGYVDTNFGRWLFALDPTTHWNWLLTYAEEPRSRVAVVGMNFRRHPRLGRLYCVDGDEEIGFACDAQTFVHRRFEPDAELGVEVPVETEVRARNRAGYRLELAVTNESAYVHRQVIPPPEMRGPVPTIFEWDLIESLVHAEGVLVSPAGARRRITGRGIKEYPVTRMVLPCSRSCSSIPAAGKPRGCCCTSATSSSARAPCSWPWPPSSGPACTPS